MLQPPGAAPDEWSVDLLDESSRTGDTPALDLPRDLEVVTFQPGSMPTSSPLEALAFRAYRGLHIAVMDASAVAEANSCGVVTGVYPLHPSFATSHSLVSALDTVAHLIAVNQMEHAPRDVQIGGIDAASADGYPYLRADGLLDLDPTVRWRTQAALLPVVNLSLGPRSIRHEVVAGDVVQHATHYLSRACVIVAAAGNSGGMPGRETMSAWAEPPWVLAVGATEDEEGTGCGRGRAAVSRICRRAGPTCWPAATRGSMVGRCPCHDASIGFSRSARREANRRTARGTTQDRMDTAGGVYRSPAS